MKEKELKEFIRIITQTILQAGELAITSQGTVINVGKEYIEINDSDSDRIKLRGRAKTEIDEKIQEMLLFSVLNVLGIGNLKIDAEEDTPSRKLFNTIDPSLTIVIDPIDGTLEYIEGSKRYSINIGLIEKGVVVTALIYFPMKKQMYYLNEFKKPYLAVYNQSLELEGKAEINPSINVNSRYIYTNNRVSSNIISCIEKNNFNVIQDDGKVQWPEALLKCISGEYAASIFHTPQMRDVLLGALIENLPGGYMVDWEGQKISWPDEGRIQRVVFGFGILPEEVVKCLK